MGENLPVSQKKAAFLIYPSFCLYEIAVTLELLAQCGKTVDIYALDKEPVLSEEGLRVVPDKTLDEFDIGEYDCVLLSGIGGNPDAVIYNQNYISFLRQFCDENDILIAAISLSPVLLAQAGLLRGKRFCVGMYEEDREELSFFEYENQVRAPLVADGNVITAMGMAFREFGIAVARKLGYECRDGAFGEIKYPIKPEDYIFRVTE
ncbi:MAG: DJ-1/PfpI family protein [Defluviitaleaceae bacterium]|nr:DJ-1/PfpI family protein [Defluviitaleaceae bacterium]